MPETRVLFLIGQTGTGKSAVAAILAAKIGAEIISLDSMKIYRGMDIITAKPPAERRRKVPHHMMDIAEPHEHFDTALYVKDAERAVSQVTSRGAAPLFVGGTALYLKALTEGIFEGPAAAPEFRAKLRRQASELGTLHLHQRLEKLDPVAARKIHSSDLRRIERALEVYEKTGKPISQLQKQFARPSEKHDTVIMGLRREKTDLRQRIDRRVDSMMAKGLLEEVRRLGSSPRPPGKEASQALGYKELLAYLRGEGTLTEAVELVKLHTRQFAKAQMTWFKRLEGVEWFDVAADEAADQVAERLAAYAAKQV